MVSNIPNTNNFQIDGTLKGSTTPGQSGPKANDDERVPQNWRLTIRSSLESHPGPPLFGQVLPICREYSQCILTPTNKAVKDSRS